MFYNFRKNKKAFTLVELIVVIAIIAILGAVAGVTVSVFVNRARKTAATNPLTELAGVWDAKQDSQTLKDYLNEVIKAETIDSVKISDSAKLSNKTFGSSDTFTLYFHDDNCGDFYGVLTITKGVCASTAEAKDDATTVTNWGKAAAVKK